MTLSSRISNHFCNTNVHCYSLGSISTIVYFSYYEIILVQHKEKYIKNANRCSSALIILSCFHHYKKKEITNTLCYT